MSTCSCITDISRHRKCSIFLCLWALIGGIVALIFDDKNACRELRQMVMVTGIVLSVFSFLYLVNVVCWEKAFPFILLINFIFVAFMDVILIYIIYYSGHENALVSDECSDDDRTLPWFMISWLSLFIFVFTVLVCLMARDSEGFSSKSSRSVDGELKTLLL